MSNFIELHFDIDSPISLQKCGVLSVQPFTDKPYGLRRKKTRVILSTGMHLEVLETYDEIIDMLEKEESKC